MVETFTPTKKMIIEPEFIERAKRVKLLLMDCDGVLTDGKLYYGKNGEEMKVFHVRDGQGLVMWHKAGFQSGIISGRGSLIVENRAVELGIDFVKLNSKNKLKCFQEILTDANVESEEVAFVGDDLPDLDLFDRVGFSVAVADAVPAVLSSASYVTNAKGGLGAVREITDLLLKVKNR